MENYLIEIDFDSFAESFGLAGATELFREMHMGSCAKQVTHHFRQVEHARSMQGAQPIEGLGQASMTIDPQSFHYWGQRLGYACWDDEQFLREYRRDNPLSAVRGAPSKTVIVNQWGRPATGEDGE